MWRCCRCNTLRPYIVISASVCPDITVVVVSVAAAALFLISFLLSAPSMLVSLIMRLVGL